MDILIARSISKQCLYDTLLFISECCRLHHLSIG
jgi:hypothetical protein